MLASATPFATVQASTTISGAITYDTTWTLADSPYTLSGNILVKNGVTLTVEAGVTVNLGDYYIQVNGTLQAIGSATNQIHFNDGKIVFTQYSADWNQTTATGCIISSSAVSSTISLGSAAIIGNNMIQGAIDVAKTNGVPVIMNNTISGMISVEHGGMLTIKNNVIVGRGIMLGASNSTVVGNLISGSGTSTGILVYTMFWDEANPTAWSNSTSLIEGNLIMNNDCGIHVQEAQGSHAGSPIIRNNTIAKNNVGIYLTWIGIAAPNPAIAYNNIYDNKNYNLKTALPNDRNATSNWWGTADPQAANQTIYDYKNDFNLGKVNILPLLSEPNPAAPTSNVTIPNPTPTSYPTVTPTPTPTATSLPTPSTSPTASSSPAPTPNPTATPFLPVQLSITADASAPAVGSAVYVSGRLSVTQGNPIENGKVILFYAIAGDITYFPIGSCSTDANGAYLIQWVPTASGAFSLKVEWQGNSTYPACSNATTLSFVPYQNQGVFMIESNSTVSSLAFNSTNSELSFEVNGATGTNGYVKTTIAKTITANPENIRVYLDGNQLTYTCVSNENSWLLTFSYTHSTHQVAINMAAEEAPMDNIASSNADSPTEIAIIASAIAIVIAVALISIRLGRRKTA